MKLFLAILGLAIFFPFAAKAETTNALLDAEIQGGALAQKILEQQPAENFTNSGVLKIHDAKGKISEVPVVFETVVKPMSWLNTYEADLSEESSQGWTNCGESLTIEHSMWLSNHYEIRDWSAHGIRSNGVAVVYFDFDPKTKLIKSSSPLSSKTLALTDSNLFTSFAGSDFYYADLGLEFFHWPRQKVLKKEFHRQCACTVLESTNPNPTNGYSRVVSWIDNDSLGIVEAYAYDANGKKLKNFYPKDFKKVNGQYQVQTIIMENLQTGSKTRLEFDLKP
jgi:hypothetical protein